MADIYFDHHNGDDIGSSERARQRASWSDYAEDLGYPISFMAPSQKPFDNDPGDVH